MSEILAKQPSGHVKLSTDNSDPAPAPEKGILKDIEYFNKSSTMKKLKKDLMINKKIKKFTDKVNGILHVIDTFQCDSKLELVFLFVLQSAEDYFDPADVDVKKAVCKDILCKYVNNDESMCESFIRLSEKNIKKTSIIRRAKKRSGKILGFFLPTW
tara:strand:+ start:3310 stop:3780 length:471 start_codon:yes stop_codon:yes gene_type:complete